MSFSQRQYSEILDALADLETFLRGLGLHKGPDRLRQLAKKVEIIEQANTSRTLACLEQREDHEELVWSLVDAVEFTDIYAGLKDEPPAVLKPLFRKALQGTLHPGRETAYKSNVGRNTAFELRLAAGIRKAGASVHLGLAADLAFDHSGARVYIECKRPFGIPSIRPNVIEARRQLRTRLDADSHPLVVGLVAVSVSRAINPGSRLFVADDPAALRNLASDIQSIHATNSSDYDRLPDLRILGILYHVFTPAYVRSIPLLTAASQALLFLSGAAIKASFPVSNGAPLKSLLQAAL
jgi:hypothetical protein